MAIDQADYCACCRALHELLEQIPPKWRQCMAGIAVAGTTTTSVLVDRHDGHVLADPILYNEPQSRDVVSSAQVTCLLVLSCSWFDPSCV